MKYLHIFLFKNDTKKQLKRINHKIRKLKVKELLWTVITSIFYIYLHMHTENCQEKDKKLV